MAKSPPQICTDETRIFQTPISPASTKSNPEICLLSAYLWLNKAEEKISKRKISRIDSRAASGKRPLFFKARAGRIADLKPNLFVVRADFAQCPIAPAMAAIIARIAVRRKEFIRLRGNIHFFGAEMLADVGGFHG